MVIGVEQRMRDFKPLLGISLTLGMIVFALPRLHMGHGFTLAAIFGVIWISLALLIVAAHLRDLLGVDQEVQSQQDRIKRFRRWQMEQKLSGKNELLNVKRQD